MGGLWEQRIVGDEGDCDRAGELWETRGIVAEWGIVGDEGYYGR